MRERLLIAAGLALFLGLLFYPFWWPSANASGETATPVLSPQNTGHCVAPESFMRASHMRLLDQWRTDAVRHGVRQVHLSDGRVFDASLSGTCLSCHSKVEFCDSCHSYSGVSEPSCWQCHNDPRQTAPRQAAQETPR